MVSSVLIKNFGPIKTLDWTNLGTINVVIGANASGKTFLLKAIYSSIKALEQYKRGKEYRSFNEILAEKLYWTFQPDSLGNLVSKGEKELSFRLSEKEGSMAFSFGDSTTKSILKCDRTLSERLTNSIFIPAKEVLSLQSIILQSKSDKMFGFDATYTDLAEALMIHVKQGKNVKAFADVRRHLKDDINGRIEFNEEKKEWVFRDNNRYAYSVTLTSEGVKKLSILDVLFGNHYLSKESVVFLDEPDCSLHPSLLSSFMESVAELARAGIQFFIASHSYSVIKKLYIVAHRDNLPIPIVSFDDTSITFGDLGQEMPHNRIIDESINLYKEELSL